VNFYLEEARASERADIIDLVKLETPAASQRLAGYVREAMSAFALMFATSALTDIQH